MSLSFSEIKRVREQWATIYQDPAGNGALFLKAFLDKHDYYHKFARLKDAPRDTILLNPIFRNHTAKMMQTIDDSIANLEEPEVLKERLKVLGQAHAQRKIKPLQFEQLKVVILDMLKNQHQLPDEDHKAFTRMFDYLLTFIFEGLKK